MLESTAEGSQQHILHPSSEDGLRTLRAKKTAHRNSSNSATRHDVMWVVLLTHDREQRLNERRTSLQKKRKRNHLQRQLQSRNDGNVLY